MAARTGSTILAAGPTPTDPTSSEDTNNRDAESEPNGVASPQKHLMSPAETLAVAVFGFVHSATLLGRAVGRSHGDQESQEAARANVFESIPNHSGEEQPQLEGDESTSKEDQVQLLRLRTKRQEIIIYPDTNYLCCVIQSVGKQANGLA